MLAATSPLHVAPRAGARIETVIDAPAPAAHFVAPRAGARIEERRARPQRATVRRVPVAALLARDERNVGGNIASAMQLFCER